MFFACEGTVGIEPSVEFDTAFVGFFDSEAKGVPSGTRGRAHFAGEEGRPGFELRGIHGIAGRANLEDEGIEAQVSGFLDESEELGASLFGGETGFAGPVDIADGGDPCAAKFARGRWRCWQIYGYCGRYQQGQDQAEEWAGHSIRCTGI